MFSENLFPGTRLGGCFWILYLNELYPGHHCLGVSRKKENNLSGRAIFLVEIVRINYTTGQSLQTNCPFIRGRIIRGAIFLRGNHPGGNFWGQLSREQLSRGTLSCYRIKDLIKEKSSNLEKRGITKPISAFDRCS